MERAENMEDPAIGDQFRVELTDKAARVIREAYAAEQVDPAQSFIRVGALPGGCSGYKFTIDFAEAGQVSESDARFVSQGINVAVDKACLIEVMGSVEVDYRDDNIVEVATRFRATMREGLRAALTRAAALGEIDPTKIDSYAAVLLLFMLGTAVIVRGGGTDAELLGQLDAMRVIVDGWRV